MYDLYPMVPFSVTLSDP